MPLRQSLHCELVIQGGLLTIFYKLQQKLAGKADALWKRFGFFFNLQNTAFSTLSQHTE